MKNYLTALVAVGLGAAYWYQMPEPSKPVVVPVRMPTPAPAVHRFQASPTLLDEPAIRVGSRTYTEGLYLGSEQAAPSTNAGSARAGQPASGRVSSSSQYIKPSPNETLKAKAAHPVPQAYAQAENS